MFRRLLVMAALLLTLIGLNGCNRKGENGPVKITGTVETTTVSLSFKVPGRLSERLVDEGDDLVAGQLVARLEDDELKDELRARDAELQAAQAAVRDMRAGSRREEIAQGEANLSRLRAEGERAFRDFVRADALFRKEVIPRRDLDAAVAAKDSSIAAVREAEERLNLLKAGPRPDALRQAMAREDGAGAVRSLAATRLSQAVLTSPMAGAVLAKHVERGELLSAGAPVITVARLDEVWVRGYIPETSLGKVKLGQKVAVTSDTWKGRAYEGRVTFIASEAEFTPRNVQTEAERVKLVYRIKITIANPKRELKPGMPVDAAIVTP